MRAKYVIAGVGHTAHGKLPGRSTVSLNLEACRNALADAGIEKDAVDGLLVKYPTSQYQFGYAQIVAEAMGLQPRVGGVWDQGGASNISMIAYAAMSIDAGQCEIALVCGADNPRTGTTQANEQAWHHAAAYGAYGTAPAYALIAQRHMQEFGTTQQQLGAIAIACRRHGAQNPDAHLQLPLNQEMYAAARWIAEPLKRDDCCLVSDGGAAVVVMSAQRARQLGTDNAVPILGFGQGQTSWEVEQRSDLTTTCAVESAETAFKMAGCRPQQIDVAQIYDCFTITPLITLEDYGFCKKGQGGNFGEDGRIEIGGELPMNTSGGLLSESGMPGMQLVIEGVRQMRGDANSQVPGASKCVVSNQGGHMHTHSTLVLGQ